MLRALRLHTHTHTHTHTHRPPPPPTHTHTHTHTHVGRRGGGGLDSCDNDRQALCAMYSPKSSPVSHSKHRFPAPSSKEGCGKPVLGLWPRLRGYQDVDSQPLRNDASTCMQSREVTINVHGGQQTYMTDNKRA